MQVAVENTYNEEALKANTKAKKMMLYMAMASITMFFAVTTSSLIIKKGDALNWAQFALPSIFALSTIVAIASSVFFQWAFNSYKKANFKTYLPLLMLGLVFGMVFLGCQLLGFNALEKMGMLLSGNVSGSYIYFLAIAHGLHIIMGVLIGLIVWFKSKRAISKDQIFEAAGNSNPSRLLSVELLTAYWHFVNVLWVYLYVFFYFNYQ